MRSGPRVALPVRRAAPVRRRAANTTCRGNCCGHPISAVLFAQYKKVSRAIWGESRGSAWSVWGALISRRAGGQCTQPSSYSRTIPSRKDHASRDILSFATRIMNEAAVESFFRKIHMQLFRVVSDQVNLGLRNSHKMGDFSEEEAGEGTRGNEADAFTYALYQVVCCLGKFSGESWRLFLVHLRHSYYSASPSSKVDNGTPIRKVKALPYSKKRREPGVILVTEHTVSDSFDRDIELFRLVGDRPAIIEWGIGKAGECPPDDALRFGP